MNDEQLKKLDNEYKKYVESAQSTCKSIMLLEKMAKKRLNYLNKHGIHSGNTITYLKEISESCEKMIENMGGNHESKRTD